MFLIAENEIKTDHLEIKTDHLEIKIDHLEIKKGLEIKKDHLGIMKDHLVDESLKMKNQNPEGIFLIFILFYFKVLENLPVLYEKEGKERFGTFFSTYFGYISWTSLNGDKVQSNPVISNSLISNNRLSRSENLVPVLI